MAEKGHKVCIAYNANKGINSKHIPKFAVYLIRKILGTFGPTWFRLNRSVKQKVMYDFARKIPASKITIATALETSFFLLSKINTKKYYFVQDFENWGISDEEVCRTYAFDMKKIAVAKWLKAEIEKYANESVCYVPNGVDPKVFNIRNKKRPEHSIAMLYHKDRRKGCDISLAVVHRLKQIYLDLVVNAFGSPHRPKDWPEWIKYTRNAPPQEVSEIMNNSLVFLCTSRVEGFGLTGLESIFCGCVLVSTNTKGCLEYASHDNALICNVDDVEDIVGKVCSAFDNIKLRERLLSNCRGVPEKFSIEKSKENFYKCIEDMPC